MLHFDNDLDKLLMRITSVSNSQYSTLIFSFKANFAYLSSRSCCKELSLIAILAQATNFRDNVLLLVDSFKNVFGIQCSEIRQLHEIL